ncbi:leukocyte elastase inhibitor [Dermacentor silvarum]|uniref:leukocyte elastase inhibitor n=1 Tax=Dermacentor silvarum TaxID=543639 RepID=UPI0021015401|nr:leukocyte elastase inhibitor [Dermacentor silvarum]
MNADGSTKCHQATSGGGSTSGPGATNATATGAATPVTELDRVVAYANRFSIKLFKHVAALDSRSTVCIGPFAVFKTLCMAYAAAQGNTEHQMAKAFKVNKRFEMHGAFQVLLSLIRNKAAEVRQDMACHAFVERSLPIVPQFEAVLERKYGAEVRRVDMKDEPDSVRVQVNSTVEKETSGAIPQLLVSGVTDMDTRLVFCDSLFIKASWETVFPAAAAATEKHPYTVTSSRSGSGGVGGASDHGPELIRISGVYRHCRDSENKLLAVEVPLRGGQLSLLLFMADNAPSLRRFHKHLSLELYERLLDKLQDTGERISVLVPKMHLEEMVQPSYVLKHMGFLDLFDEHANLAGVGQDLFVSDIIHKVALTIDTTGVTAATAVSLSLTNFYTEELPKAYRDAANTRPFIYILKNQETDLILFVGATQDI